jgi:hypothetical protein
LKQQLRGDLDCILLKSLEKDPVLRYGSAEQFSNDVKHYLEGGRVDARRQILAYEAWQWIRRFYWWLIAGGALVLSIIDRFVPVPLGVFAVYVLIVAAGTYNNVGRVFGKSFQRRKGPGVAKSAAVALLVAAGLTSVVIHRMPSRVPLTPVSIAIGTFITLLTMHDVFLWWRVLFWQRRIRLLGPIVRDFTLPRARLRDFFRRKRREGVLFRSPVSVIITISLGIVVFTAAWWFDSVVDWPVVVIYDLMLLGIIPGLLLHGNCEVRDRGLAWCGRLVPWNNLVSFAWESDPGVFEALRLQVKYPGPFGTSREVTIGVLPADRPFVHEALEQQLSVWP